MATKAQAIPLVGLEVRVNRSYKSGIAGTPLSGTELRLRSIFTVLFLIFVSYFLYLFIFY